MAEVCYKCGSWKTDNYPSHFCSICRGELMDKVPAKDPLAALRARLTDEDRTLLWVAGIRLDADLMDVKATMSCPRCKEQASKSRLEDSFRCWHCGWDSETKVTFPIERNSK